MRAVLNGLVVNLFTFCDFRIYYRVVVISDMATRNTSYVGASATPKDAEASESVAKDTHSVSKRFFCQYLSVLRIRGSLQKVQGRPGV